MKKITLAICSVAIVQVTIFFTYIIVIWGFSNNGDIGEIVSYVHDDTSPSMDAGNLNNSATSHDVPLPPFKEPADVNTNVEQNEFNDNNGASLEHQVPQIDIEVTDSGRYPRLEINQVAHPDGENEELKFGDIIKTDKTKEYVEDFPKGIARQVNDHVGHKNTEFQDFNIAQNPIPKTVFEITNNDRGTQNPLEHETFNAIISDTNGKSGVHSIGHTLSSDEVATTGFTNVNHEVETNLMIKNQNSAEGYHRPRKKKIRKKPTSTADILSTTIRNTNNYAHSIPHYDNVIYSIDALLPPRREHYRTRPFFGQEHFNQVPNAPGVINMHIDTPVEQYQKEQRAHLNYQHWSQFPVPDPISMAVNHQQPRMPLPPSVPPPSGIILKPFRCNPSPWLKLILGSRPCYRYINV